MLGAVIMSPATLEPIIQQMAQKYGVDPNLVKATIKQESNWDMNASRYEAHKGDASWGLMQLLLSTARQVLGQPNLTTTDLINPATNIEAGTKLLAQNWTRWGNLKDAIASYNAGSPRIDPKTGKYVNQDYVTKVWNNYLMYQKLGSVATYLPTVPVEVSNVGMYALMGALVFGMVYVAGGKKSTAQSTGVAT